jgi:hypothetical protein
MHYLPEVCLASSLRPDSEAYHWANQVAQRLSDVEIREDAMKALKRMMDRKRSLGMRRRASASLEPDP